MFLFNPSISNPNAEKAGSACIVAINRGLEHIFAQKAVLIDEEARSLYDKGHNIENFGAAISRIPNSVLSPSSRQGLQQDSDGQHCFELLVSAVTSHSG